ncbi:MAG: hypothetical protein ABI664_09905 [bacterium]
MRIIQRIVVMAGVLVLGSAFENAGAQTATQTVTFSVVAINRVAVSGSAGPLVVTTANPGAAPTSATMGGTSYGITTNEINQKISAAIDSPMPSGMTLAVALAAPAGAASRGTMTLGTASADVVTGISAVNASALPITYTLSASATAPVAPGSRTVTFTIAAGQ